MIGREPTSPQNPRRLRPSQSSHRVSQASGPHVQGRTPRHPHESFVDTERGKATRIEFNGKQLGPWFVYVAARQDRG